MASEREEALVELYVPLGEDEGSQNSMLRLLCSRIARIPALTVSRNFSARALVYCMSGSDHWGSIPSISSHSPNLSSQYSPAQSLHRMA
eukprot:873559-Rhodomonas_salina.1